MLGNVIEFGLEFLFRQEFESVIRILPFDILRHMNGRILGNSLKSFYRRPSKHSNQFDECTYIDSFFQIAFSDSKNNFEFSFLESSSSADESAPDVRGPKPSKQVSASDISDAELPASASISGKESSSDMDVDELEKQKAALMAQLQQVTVSGQSATDDTSTTEVDETDTEAERKPQTEEAAANSSGQEDQNSPVEKEDDHEEEKRKFGKSPKEDDDDQGPSGSGPNVGKSIGEASNKEREGMFYLMDCFFKN